MLRLESLYSYASYLPPDLPQTDRENGSDDKTTHTKYQIYVNTMSYCNVRRKYTEEYKRNTILYNDVSLKKIAIFYPNIFLDI